jgi:hypothetical protein
MLTRALMAVGGLALLAGCSDGEDRSSDGAGLDLSSTTSAPASDADGEAAVCRGLEETLLLPVDAEYPEDDSALLDALEAVAANGPDRPSADATMWLELVRNVRDGVGPGTSDAELNSTVAEGYQALARVYGWALDACPVEGIVWACPETTARTALPDVGEDVEEEVTTPTEPGAATPEEVVDTEADGVGERVEVRRTDAEVVVAWLDDDGHAVEVVSARDDAGWRSDGSVTCSYVADPLGSDD